MLNLDISYFESSVDSDQLASCKKPADQTPQLAYYWNAAS